MTNPHLPVLPDDFCVRIRFVTDWHIGAGAGRHGQIDRLVLRDSDRCPFVPAKTLTGIWRDACEQVALGLDDGKPRGLWSRWTTYLFGTETHEPGAFADNRPPRPAALCIGRAQFPEPFRAAFRTRPALHDAITFIKPGVRIDQSSGRVADDNLRFEEMVRAGGYLEARCRLNGTGLLEAQRQAVTALLAAGARMVRGIGSKRRRGSGECRLELWVDGRPLDVETWLDWLDQDASFPEPPDPHPVDDRPPDRVPRPAAAPAAAASRPWWVLDLRIHCLSPVLAFARQAGNVVETLDYVPGTYLLPLVSRCLTMQGCDPAAALAAGGLVVSNATVEVAGTRGLPVPWAWFRRKDDAGLVGSPQQNPPQDDAGDHEGPIAKTVYNLLAESPPDGVQLKGFREGYVASPPWQARALPAYVRVERAAVTHNTIEDAVQRPTAAVGGVYTYEAIPEGTVLRAEVRMRGDLAEALPPDWWHGLGGTHRMGRSKKDDYGLVDIEIAGHRLVTADDLMDIGAVEGRLTVWLVSDLLLRDQRLRPDPSAEGLAEALAEALGGNGTLQLVPRDAVDDAAAPAGGLLSRIGRVVRRDSWHVRWGLPRPSLIGLRAGSCFVFEVRGGRVNREKLAQLQMTGLGERRAEGYGQVRFNDLHVHTPTPPAGVTVAAVTSKSQPSPSGDLDDELAAYARRIEDAAWRQQILLRAEAFAGDARSRAQHLELKPGRPAAAQLGALRAALRAPGGPEAVARWLKAVRGNERRSQEWGDSLHAISKLVAPPEDDPASHPIWTKLALSGADAEACSMTGDGRERLFREHWFFAVQALLVECARRHARDSQNAASQAVNQGLKQHGT